MIVRVVESICAHVRDTYVVQTPRRLGMLRAVRDLRDLQRSFEHVHRQRLVAERPVGSTEIAERHDERWMLRAQHSLDGRDRELAFGDGLVESSCEHE